MTFGILLVDSREAVLRESGDVILSNAPIYAEVGEIFAGTKPKPPSGSTTVFKSVGIAVEEIAAAKLVYEATALAGGSFPSPEAGSRLADRDRANARCRRYSGIARGVPEGVLLRPQLPLI